ncbi:bifunctional DNA primase/polymerase [Streptomyces sp. RPT161]|uniref:bifunctional DNA primase/polymerase n=1 Tax=Streptomyces sp. RPT161 TaxID=3015993 RepID=UPI0022B8F7D3|nr:bifunctional DNA primase/polymerase [Streptomyces sp. RPT161]
MSDNTAPVAVDRTAAKPRMIVAAQQYAARDWRVLPLRYVIDGRCSCGNPKAVADHDYRQGGKHPRYNSWTEEASTDWAVIAGWWRNEPNANIGIATGEASGIFVLDIDPDSGGLDSLRALEAEHGPLPKTWTVETGSGGQHRYFAWPGFNPKNSAGKLGPGLDIRADGGQVVAPPSVSVKGPYTVKDDAHPTQAPAWLLDRLRPAPPRPAAPATSIPIRSENIDSYTRKALQAECDAITGAADGEQNNTINTAAFNVGTLVGAGALSEAEAREALLSAALAGNHPEGRARPTIESGLKAGMAQPRHPWPPASRRDDAASLMALVAWPGDGPQDEPPEDSDEAPAEPADRLPATFWNATPTLGQIRQMARARRTSPDAVLHAVLARTAAMADPTVRVDNGIHQPATLCWYCGLFGPSGSGKGQAENTAEELTPFPNIDLAYIDISTGQGLIAAYLDLDIDPDDVDGKKKILVQKRTRGYALATEGSVLDAMAQMSAAATLNGVLCKAWMSERQGTSNAEVERRRALPKGAYTLSMSLGVQEEPAAKLLEMGSIGLPQRLAWAHATLGPDTPKERPATTGPVTITTRNGQDIPVTNWVASLRNTVIPVPAHVTQELDELALEISFGRGSEFPLDTHEPLWRVKCAALLALLHGRTTITSDDWDRAAVMWQTSRKVRDSVQETARRRMQAEQDARRAEAVLTAVESQAAVYEVMNGVHPSVVNVAKRAHRYLTRKGGEIPLRDVNRACVATSDRDKYRASGATDSLWTAALRYGCEQGWLVALAEGALLTAGSVSPEQS